MLASALGLRWAERGVARFTWGEISNNWGLALELCLFEEHYSARVHLGWPNIYLRLPFLQCWHYEPRDMMESWGGSWVGGDSIHLHWGTRTKIIHMPWSWEWQRTSHLLADGVTWAHDLGPSRNVLGAETGHRDKFGLFRQMPVWERALSYRYVLRSGEVQQRTATIQVREMEWRWRWFQWLPFPRRVRRSIDVNFNDEVGERSGSWKGGCLGCGYDLRSDETPEECLRRMEWERKF